MGNVTINLDEFKKKVTSYNRKDWDIIEKAYFYAEKCHKNQKRASGEPYIMHPLNVAYILASMHADADTLCAALLHDVVEDTKTSLSDLTKEFNEKTASQEGLVIPVVVTIFADRSFKMVLKTPPAAVLVKKACGIDSGSANSIKNKVAKISKAQIKEIAELKMPDLNASSVESAMSMIEGTCRSMGVVVEE